MHSPSWDPVSDACACTGTEWCVIVGFCVCTYVATHIAGILVIYNAREEGSQVAHRKVYNSLGRAELRGPSGGFDWLVRLCLQDMFTAFPECVDSIAQVGFLAYNWHHTHASLFSDQCIMHK